MEPWLLEHAVWLRFGAVFGVFVVLAAWEARAPRRRSVSDRSSRWGVNVGLLALSTGAVRLIAPAGSVGAALFARERGLGLFEHAGTYSAVAFLVSFVVLDLGVWVQHVAMHRVPVLWRMHRVHHADEDLDTTSGVRFHPFEILVSLGWKAALIIALGAPVAAVIVYEIALASLSIATHANIGLPERLERVARAFAITPDLHRIHHSVEEEESQSNFGTVTSAWDRLFGTLRGEARAKQTTIPLGVIDGGRAPAKGFLDAVRAPFR